MGVECHLGKMWPKDLNWPQSLETGLVCDKGEAQMEWCSGVPEKLGHLEKD